MTLNTQNIPIKYIDYGIGYFCNDNNGNPYIELNKNLKKYPELYRMVLKHELGHNTNKKMHFLHDLKDGFNFKNQLKLFSFSLNHPRAFLANFPIFLVKKELVINRFMFMVWGSIVGIFVLGGLFL